MLRRPGITQRMESFSAGSSAVLWLKLFLKNKIYKFYVKLKRQPRRKTIKRLCAFGWQGNTCVDIFRERTVQQHSCHKRLNRGGNQMSKIKAFFAGHKIILSLIIAALIEVLIFLLSLPFVSVNILRHESGSCFSIAFDKWDMNKVDKIVVST